MSACSLQSKQTNEKKQLTLLRLDMLGIEIGVDKSISDVFSIDSSTVANPVTILPFVISAILLLLSLLLLPIKSFIVVTTTRLGDGNFVITSTVVDNSLTLSTSELVVPLFRLCSNIRPNTIIIELSNISTAMPKNKQI